MNTEKNAALVLEAQEQRDEYVMACLLGTSNQFGEEHCHKPQSTSP